MARPKSSIKKWPLTTWNPTMLTSFTAVWRCRRWVKRTTPLLSSSRCWMRSITRPTAAAMSWVARISIRDAISTRSNCSSDPWLWKVWGRNRRGQDRARQGPGDGPAGSPQGIQPTAGRLVRFNIAHEKSRSLISGPGLFCVHEIVRAALCARPKYFQLSSCFSSGQNSSPSEWPWSST